MERRIAAILAADMVGYSRLIELDEAGILARQKRHRIELIDPAIARHNGHVVKLTGDGLIAEFGSVVEAVQCAVLAQREMAAREAGEPEDRRIRYRIGIHIGDVVFDDGDVYGDGVNIAARLESLAEPGGIVVSGTAHDMLKRQVDVDYRALGEKHLKNIATPVRVFAVTDRAAEPVRRPARRWPWAAALAAVAIAGLSAVWSWPSRPDFTPAQTDRIAFAIPEKPSIAVAPFANITDNPEVDWLSEGLSANLIAALATSPDMVVISRNALDDMVGDGPAKIAERYGVRYVLDGTVQGDGRRIRVGARLADALEGRTLWAAKWDRPLDDVFAIQDEIADAILQELQVKLTLGEQARIWRMNAGSAENMRALVEGRGAFQTFRAEDHGIAARHWNGIMARNPDLPLGMNLQGWLHWHKVAVGISKNPVEDLKAAQDWARKAIDAGLEGHSHILYATASQYLQQGEVAADYARQALEFAPGEADVVMLAGLIFARLGRLEEGIDLMRRGMRLEPDYPDWLAAAMVGALLETGRLDEAKALAKDIVDRDVRDVNARFNARTALAVIAAWESKIAEARGHMRVMLDMRPGLTLNVMRTDPRYGFNAREYDPDFAERYVAGLLAAGLPER